ncbi:MAG TPA: ribonuclease HII [Bacteroidales bacterium]|nr:ribonuclease HII [Bacteroidales bacterium]
MLKSYYTEDMTEAGCDEAGRGCLAGPVFAAAVILPRDFRNEELRDSKKLTVKQRLELRTLIQSSALAWSVSRVEAEIIDRINILNASFLAMHQAVRGLGMPPQLLLIDGNRFEPFPGIPHICVIRGDDQYLSIAAASVLAKTYRDEYMLSLHELFPQYHWNRNKGYSCKLHREGIMKYGSCVHHRQSFNLVGQLKLEF